MAPRGRPSKVAPSKKTLCKFPIEEILQLVHRLILDKASKVATPRSSVPPPRIPPRRSTRNAIALEIPDSDGIEEIVSSDAVSKPSFRGVYIPPVGRSTTRRGQTTTSTSTASLSSVSDSRESSRYDTPATSTVQTPLVMSHSASKSTVGATARAIELSTSNFALGGSKRRRGRDTSEIETGYEQEDNDSKIAMRLQAEEYNVIEDSEESDSEPLSKKRKVTQQSNPTIEVLQSSDEDDISLAKSLRRGLPMRNLPPPRRFPSVSDDESDLDSLPSNYDDTSSNFDLISLSATPSEAASNAAPTPIAATAPSTGFPTLRLRGWSPADGDMRDFNLAKKRQKRERKKLEKAHPEIITMWSDLKNIAPIKPVAAKQPESINRKLKGFQLEGLDWMIKQEKSQWKGGLLGDEMGMGKTIQAVSLIMSDWPAKEPTLVLVPPVALMQWQSEISDYTSGKLKVLVYHTSANPKCKLLTVKDLKKYDVIMVSYAGLENMYRKQYKGWNRNDGIVKEDSILHSIKYHRLILDEAHSIKSRTASVAKACFALRADYKWCLSGTPVQNRIGEFFSLLRFLQVMPFACYFCKSCDCRELHWSQNEQKMCTQCKHSGFSHVSVFNQEILNPITGNDAEKRKEGLDKLRLITDRIMLRRMKRDYTSSMELPPKDVIIHNEFFGEMERDFSQSIMSNTNREFDTYVAQGVMLNNYANIFGLIMQMRQVANHPDLILRKHAEGGQNVLVCRICDEPAEEAIRSRCRHEFCRQCAKSYVQSFDGADGDADCPACHIPLVIDWDQPEIEQDEENVKKSSIINRIKMDDWTSSTKIEMLVYDLYKLRSKKQTHKSIVFSQFTSMLQLVQWRLQKSGFSTVLLDGSMSPAQRQKSIDHFMNNVDVEVFLVSLKAGGVALNLTEASRVYIVDP